MNFDDHEIWNRPVPESAPEAAAAVEPAAASPANGRLYASAAAPPHPDAVVALPHHTRNFVSVAELPDEPLPPPPAPPAPQAPIINDPAIAEVLAPTPVKEGDTPSFDWANSVEVGPEPLEEFKDWFADETKAPVIATPPVQTGLAAQQRSDAALRARTQLQELGEFVTTGSFGVRQYAVFAFAVTAVVAVVDAALGGTLGGLFGFALLASTALGASKLGASDRWAGWVMPAYIAIAAILVAGQFTNSAPGFNVVGQVLLVGTTLISIAPWLAAATVVGAVMPRLKRR